MRSNKRDSALPFRLCRTLDNGKVHELERRKTREDAEARLPAWNEYDAKYNLTNHVYIVEAPRVADGKDA